MTSRDVVHPSRRNSSASSMAWSSSTESSEKGVQSPQLLRLRRRRDRSARPPAPASAPGSRSTAPVAKIGVGEEIVISSRIGKPGFPGRGRRGTPISGPIGVRVIPEVSGFVTHLTGPATTSSSIPPTPSADGVLDPNLQDERFCWARRSKILTFWRLRKTEAYPLVCRALSQPSRAQELGADRQ